MGSRLDVTFRGSLVENACALDLEQEEGALEVVFLPLVPAKLFLTYTRTETQIFSVGLKDCSESVRGKLVNLLFHIPQQGEPGSVRMLKSDGDTGVLIALVDAAGNTIEPETTGGCWDNK